MTQLVSQTVLPSSIQSSSSSPSSNHDVPSIPGSSYSRTTSLSFEDSLDFLSDPEEQPPSTMGTHSPASQDQPYLTQTHHNPSSEVFTALTHHLVMPRLPILSNPPSNHSISSNRLPSSYQIQPCHNQSSVDPSPNLLQTDYSSSACLKKVASNPSHHHPSSSTPRFLVVGDARSAHGLGSLDAHLPSFSPFPNHLDRATELAPRFKLSDPSTYDGLIEHIESPFIRLKEILNPKFFLRLHPSCLPIPTRDDLINVVNSWIEREGYLLLLIQVESFPLSADNLEFILTLSRLIPTIPFIPSRIPPKKAMDGQAIVTRQLISKRIRHFSIPKPHHYQPFMFPNREECLVRSSKCYLDWLTVEFATSNLDRHHYPREPDFTATAGRESEDDNLEMDRWSEKVSIQMKRRRPKDLRDLERRRRDRPRFLPGPNGKILEQLAKTQHNSEDDADEMIKRRQLQAWISIDSFGLPSLTGLLKIGLGQIRREVGKFLRRFHRCILLDADDTPWQFQVERGEGSRNQLEEPDQQVGFGSAQSEDEDLSQFCLSFPQSPNPPNSPPTDSATAWFIIGLVTATTAATISVWCRNKFFYL